MSQTSSGIALMRVINIHTPLVVKVLLVVIYRLEQVGNASFYGYCVVCTILYLSSHSNCEESIIKYVVYLNLNSVYK